MSILHLGVTGGDGGSEIRRGLTHRLDGAETL